MIVFKSFFHIAKRFLTPVIIYVALMVLLSVLAVSSMGENPDALEVSTRDYRIAIDNQDAGDPVSDRLVSFLSARALVKDIGHEEKDVRDALFWRDVDYVLRIPEGFGAALLAGKPMEIPTYSSPNDYAHMYIDNYLNRFLSTLRLYRERLPEESMEDSLKRVERDLQAETQLVPARQVEEHQDDRSLAWFLRYMSYPLLAAIASGLGLVLSVLMKQQLAYRNRVASMSETSRNLQLALAGWLYCTLIWLVLLAVGLLATKMSPVVLLQPKMLLLLSVSYLYMIISMAITLLVCSMTQKREVITGVTNVIALGSSFLAGVFVPLELLGDSVVRMGKVLPAYWHTIAIRTLGDADQINASHMQTYWKSMGIMVLMLAVLLAATLLINKHKRQRGV